MPEGNDDETSVHGPQDPAGTGYHRVDGLRNRSEEHDGRDIQGFAVSQRRCNAELVNSAFHDALDMWGFNEMNERDVTQWFLKYGILLGDVPDTYLVSLLHRESDLRVRLMARQFRYGM